MLLSLIRAAGGMVLTLMPDLADPRTDELLKQAHYRSQADMETFIGIKTCFVAAVILLGIICASGNPFMLLLCIPAAGAAWFVPNFILAGRVKK